MKLILNKKEVNAVSYALKFYAHDTTHEQSNEEDEDPSPGLPEGKEKDLLQSVLIKLDVLRGK